MKRRKNASIWYNTHCKEVGGIVLEGREAILRQSGPCSVPRTAAGLTRAYPNSQTTIL